MKISEILNYVNTFEKNHFLRIIEQVLNNDPKNSKTVEKILNQIDGQIKNADNLSVEQIFHLVEEEYQDFVIGEFSSATSQLDILVDIIVRDGNSLMSREWLLKLYEKAVRQIRSKSKSLHESIESESVDLRTNEYRLYRNCVRTAYNNDLKDNRDRKVTHDEQSILNTLIDGLDLSHEEVKLINYSVIPLKKLEIDDVINYLVKIGIILYSKKHHQIYVPDEVVMVLRKIRGREVSDKVFRRVLRQLKSSHINLVARKHNIERKMDVAEKINEIIREGLNFTKVMLFSIHKEGINKTEKKNVIVDLIDKKLKIETIIRGASLEDKFTNLIKYFNDKDQEDNISISVHGYEKLISDLMSYVKDFEKIVRAEYEIQDSTDLSAKNLLMHNLKPIDILYTIDTSLIYKFCEKRGISTRGNEIQNILKEYKDTQNLFLENYIHISNRDLAELRSNNIEIKESELGIQYENLTKLIFKKMGLNVDEELRKKINTAKDKIDILIRLDENEIIIVECKTNKDKRFNKYSSASRQVKAYKDLATKAGLKVSKTFIIASSFSEDFINECGLDYDLNLSLISSKSLLDIYNAFYESELKEFPYKILLRDVLIDSDRVIKAIKR